MPSLFPDYEFKETVRTQVCIVCGVEKPVYEFPKDGERVGRYEHIEGYPEAGTYYRKDCRVCHNAAQAKRQKIKKKNNVSKVPIGTPCDLCGNDQVRLVWDHDDLTELTRGDICNMDNTGLGHWGDCPYQISERSVYLVGDNEEKLESVIQHMRDSFPFVPYKDR